VTVTPEQIGACMAEAEEVAAEFRSVLASSDADDLRDDVAYRLATRDAAHAAAEREVGELRAALRPFAERGEIEERTWSDKPDDFATVTHISGHCLTIGDYRRAREAVRLASATLTPKAPQ
jgi:hypothetical protein